MNNAVKEKISTDKFLCYCSRVTFKKFTEHISSKSHANLEQACEDLGLAKQCAACLPNIEDEFFNLSGIKKNIGSLSHNRDKPSIKKRILRFIDYVFGDILVSQYGYLPMLASENIKTWLVISNHRPSFLKEETPLFKLSFEIFQENGKRVNGLSKIVEQNKDLKICLNDFLPEIRKEVANYFVKVIRKPLAKGLRGSTRTHFFYQAYHSMASLHTQDGGHKNRSISFTTTKNEDNNLIFFMNPQKRKSRIKLFFKDTNLTNNTDKLMYKSFSLAANGSKLIKVKNDIIKSKGLSLVVILFQ